MQFIQNILSANQILTASLLSWFIAQVLKTIINFILLGKFQLERMWGDGGMPSAHSATVCAMAIVTGRSAGVSSPIFAVACVVAIITMHDAMGVRPAVACGEFRRTVDAHRRGEEVTPAVVVVHTQGKRS